MAKNISTEILQYTDPETGDEFQGVIAWDKSITPHKPGILVSHAFSGQLQFEDDRAVELAEHGWLDPLALPESMCALAEELEARNADWQIQVHGKTGHAFTNPAAIDRDGGLFYQPIAHQRAWSVMLGFFDDLYS